MNNRVIPGMLYASNVDIPCLVFNEKQVPVESILVKAAEPILALSESFVRRFTDESLLTPRNNKMLHGLYFPPSNPEKIMCCTSFLYKDRLVEMVSIKYFVMEDYLLELMNTIRLLKLKSSHIK